MHEGSGAEWIYYEIIYERGCFIYNFLRACFIRGCFIYNFVCMYVCMYVYIAKV